MRGLVALLFLALSGCVHDASPADCPADLGGPAERLPSLADPFDVAERMLAALGDAPGPWQGDMTTTAAGATVRVSDDRPLVVYELDGEAPWTDARLALEAVADALDLPERAWREAPYADGRVVVARHQLGDGLASGDAFPEEAVEAIFLRSFNVQGQLRHELVIHPWSQAQNGAALVDAGAAEANLRTYLACAKPDLEILDIDLGVHPNGEAPLYAIREHGWGHWFWVMGSDCGGSFVVDARTGLVIHEGPDGC